MHPVRSAVAVLSVVALSACGSGSSARSPVTEVPTAAGAAGAQGKSPTLITADNPLLAEVAKSAQPFFYASETVEEAAASLADGCNLLRANGWNTTILSDTLAASRADLAPEVLANLVNLLDTACLGFAP